MQTAGQYRAQELKMAKDLAETARAYLDLDPREGCFEQFLATAAEAKEHYDRAQNCCDATCAVIHYLNFNRKPEKDRCDFITLFVLDGPLRGTKRSVMVNQKLKDALLRHFQVNSTDLLLGLTMNVAIRKNPKEMAHYEPFDVLFWPFEVLP